MKIGHFLISMFASLFLMVGNMFPLSAAAMLTLVGKYYVKSVGPDTIKPSPMGLILSVLVGVIAIVVLLIGIITLVRAAKISPKKYVALCFTGCAVLLVGAVLAWFLSVWLNVVTPGMEFIFVWPGLVSFLLVLMIWSSVFSAKKLKEEQA